MPKDPCSELSRAVTDLAMLIGEDPAFNTIDKVHAEVQRHIPELTRDELVNSIVEATSTHREVLDEVRQRIAAIKREARQDKALRELVRTLEGHLEAGTLPATQARPRPGGGEVVQTLRQTRDQLRKEIGGSVPAKRKRLAESIGRLSERLESVDSVPPVRRAELPESEELARLEFEKRRLQRLIRERIDSLRPRSFWEQAREVSAISRTIKSAFDMSAPLRQGSILTVLHPTKGARAFRDMFRSISKVDADRLNRELLDGTRAHIYEASGLHLTPLDGSLTKREEAFISRHAEKIPGVGVSGRTFITYMNALRASVFDGMAETMGATETPTLEELRRIAHYVNVASGRGTLDFKVINFEPAAVPLAQILFSPRLLASRFQYLTGSPMWGGNARTRKLIAAEYGRLIAGLTLAYGIYAAFLDEEERESLFDPRSAEFGKIRLGNTRIDPLAGLGQVVTLSGRSISQTTRRQSGEIVPITGPDVPYGQDDLWEVWGRFVRQKMAPFPGAVVNLWLKEDVVGNEVGVGGAVLDAFVPLQFEQVYETLKEHGWTEGTALSALGFFGVGINTYGPNTPVERARAALGRLEVLEDAKATTAADRGLLARLRAFESQRRRLEAAIKAREESGRDATRLREQLDEAAERAMR